MNNNNTLETAPVLFSLNRGVSHHHHPIMECSHRGLISVQDADGTSLLQVGETEARTHMRSCAKPFQLIPVIEEGILEKLSLRDIALFISSHSGETYHTQRLAEILRLNGLNESDLRCGIHAPYHLSTQLDLLLHHQKPTALHNNCSGKHTAMLLLCKKLKADPAYERLDHEIQKRILDVVSTIADYDQDKIESGIDGCSLPSFCLPLSRIALMYARLGHCDADMKHAQSLVQIWSGAVSYPEYVAGHERFDTVLMKAAQGTIFSKTGADGMQAISIQTSKRFPKGAGIAIKIIDGDHKQNIRPLVVKEILSRL
ncbi:MAG: asparaginase [Myxococcales bacterium]|nr:asparaginase [Myxococcales bacterium]